MCDNVSDSEYKNYEQIREDANEEEDNVDAGDVRFRLLLGRLELLEEVVNVVVKRKISEFELNFC